jgi:hypothetical protein
MRNHLALLAPVLVALLPACAVQARGNDYPTVERVLYVEECMRAHPGPHFEMLSKCSCTLDRIASEVSLEDFVEMNTASNANSIGGERGNTIRDTDQLQKDIRRYRQLQATAKKSCFITSEPQIR